MNSIERHLGAASKAATLVAMRSAKKEIFLVVEGDSDISLMSNALGLPRSNMLSCNGKEVLMELFSMPPTAGVDEGVIFLKDRDFDDANCIEKDGVTLLVTRRYDIEMEVLENRIFSAILYDYSVGAIDGEASEELFSKICTASGKIGALRLVSGVKSLNLDFNDIKYAKFFDHKNFNIDIPGMIRYLFAKSEVHLKDQHEVETALSKILDCRDPIDLACGKETIDILHIILSRVYNHRAVDCSVDVINRIVRISTNSDDAKAMSFYPILKNKASINAFTWVGMDL